MRLVVATTAALALVPAGGAVYTWPGAEIVKVEISPPGAGWVRSLPYYADCPSECERAVDSNQSTTLNAQASALYTFVLWEVRTGTSTTRDAGVCTTTGACAVTTENDKVVVAKAHAELDHHLGTDLLAL